MQEFIYLNNAFVKAEDAKIHVSDLGLVRGYGIFDFFRAIDGKAIFLEDHLDRFENSARLMGLPIPATRDQLRAIILESIQRHPLPLLGIKMILTGGFFRMAIFLPKPPILSLQLSLLSSRILIKA
jgi:D-alanine transaminase/branched-chain amino acid aminotransferase